MKKPVSFSLESRSAKKLSEVAKKLNGIASRSEIVEFMISEYLPDPEDEEKLKEFALKITEWKLKNSQQKERKKKSEIILPAEGG